MNTVVVNKSWTLFLDRDGVINKRKIDGYIQSVDEFVFLPGVLETIKQLGKWFGKIIMVTNQQGIGKGLFSEKDLERIHRHMLDEMNKHGGRVDAIYYSPHLATDHSIYRKPEIGMGLQAKAEFPEIDFAKSIIIGDMESDMEFGKRLGMICIGVGNEIDIRPDIFHCRDLAQALEVIVPDKV